MKTLAQMQSHLQTCKAEVRWTAVSSIHLTLKFLGEINPSTLSELAIALRTASCKADSIGIHLCGLGSFPNQKNPRIIWCGVESNSDALSSLQRTLEVICNDFGFPPENRPFRPHLTLGRVRGRKNLQHLMDRIGSGSGLECSFSADHLNIYKSVLKPQGAVYTIMETITFQ